MSKLTTGLRAFWLRNMSTDSLNRATTLSRLKETPLSFRQKGARKLPELCMHLHDPGKLEELYVPFQQCSLGTLTCCIVITPMEKRIQIFNGATGIRSGTKELQANLEPLVTLTSSLDVFLISPVVAILQKVGARTQV
ncbi:hypothetical protein SELMODRAFT_411323 [Selaginella moellendorffii]|uniref:Uncharacterized protein n=1 Tax=Selaginella moellendorffii TaxID=88036 RepID=D8RHA0_SELML|nr:hypothetical protein SELMODRAFT_411323 [Selaginella moellendorffii]